MKKTAPTQDLRGSRSGQAMLLAVLMLGATMLGATTIAGLLMAYQIRQTTNFADSAKSIFAADSGTEWALYNYFPNSGQTPTPLPVLSSSGASTSVTCYDSSSTPSPCTASSSAYGIAAGMSGGTRRAFFVDFVGATGTLP